VCVCVCTGLDIRLLYSGGKEDHDGNIREVYGNVLMMIVIVVVYRHRA